MLTHFNNTFSSFEKVFREVFTIWSNFALDLNIRKQSKKKRGCSNDDEVEVSDDIDYVPKTKVEYFKINFSWWIEVHCVD